ncbi:hypothetical protein P7C73_g3319, partial [Tremellales sp. Uapishka_1]
MATSIPVTLVGATGLTGSATLLSLLSSASPFTITALTRRAISAPVQPANASTTYANRVIEDLFTAPSGPVGSSNGVYISCLGTTRAAEGLEKQIQTDLVLNRDLAKKAKADGSDVLILVSSRGASSASYFAYPKMKGELEDDVKAMGFRKCIILQPGMLLGDRSNRPKSKGAAEAVGQRLFKGLRSIGAPVGSICVDGSEWVEIRLPLAVSRRRTDMESSVGQCIAHLAVEKNQPAEAVSFITNTEIIQHAQAFRAENPSATKA